MSHAQHLYGCSMEDRENIVLRHSASKLPPNIFFVLNGAIAKCENIKIINLPKLESNPYMLRLESNAEPLCHDFLITNQLVCI